MDLFTNQSASGPSDCYVYTPTGSGLAAVGARDVSSRGRVVKGPWTIFHALRHCYATECLRAGVHPKVVSEALGHANTAFTMDTYQHVLATIRETAAAAIEAALSLPGEG